MPDLDLSSGVRMCGVSTWSTPSASSSREHGMDDAPRVRHPEQADRWTWLVVAAYTTQLRLARTYASRTCGYRGSAAMMRGTLHPSGFIVGFQRFWCTWARPPNRRNPAVGRLGDPKVGSRARPSATRP